MSSETLKPYSLFKNKKFLELRKTEEDGGKRILLSIDLRRKRSRDEMLTILLSAINDGDFDVIKIDPKTLHIMLEDIFNNAT